MLNTTHKTKKARTRPHLIFRCSLRLCPCSLPLKAGFTVDTTRGQISPLTLWLQIIFLLVRRMEFDAVTDLNPEIWSHIRLNQSEKESERKRLKIDST
ncbi:hypothetical protein J6590_068041 [Homalodisca vitripennis]|nr:hypothetical protein J6590_068041 [Homalodisca vitripennis]